MVPTRRWRICSASSVADRCAMRDSPLVAPGAGLLAQYPGRPVTPPGRSCHQVRVDLREPDDGLALGRRPVTFHLYVSAGGGITVGVPARTGPIVTDRR